VCIVTFDRLPAIKISVPRCAGKRRIGSALDGDIDGAPQHGSAVHSVIP
jgi:hypothetical protein